MQLVNLDVVLSLSERKPVSANVCQTFSIKLKVLSLCRSSSAIFHTITFLFAASILGLWVVYKEFIQHRIEVPEHCSNLL